MLLRPRSIQLGTLTFVPPVTGEEIGEEAGLFRHINDQTSFPKTATAQQPRFFP